MSTRRFGVIGAGRFGTALAEKLAANGAEVILIDHNPDTIQSFADSPINAYLGDATSLSFLRDNGVQNCETVTIAIGEDIETSILATVHCKELGVKNVVAKAKSELHGKILQRVGADYVIYAERDRAMRLADDLLNGRSVDFYEIVDGYSVAEISAPRDLVGKTLIESGARQRYGVTILAIRRLEPDAPRKTLIASGTDVIAENDILIVFGPDRKLAELRS